jgi:hypothetical protein
MPNTATPPKTAQLTKTAQILKYFAQQYPGVPRTLLAKYVYLSDLHAREYLGRPISDFVYRQDNYGPYFGYIKELDDAGAAQDGEEAPTPPGTPPATTG